jgi:alanine dehydrogenase
MKIGVVREIKNRESRVALTPAGVRELAARGHEVRVQQGAGLGSGFSDEQYSAAGASIVEVTRAWQCDIVLKVKEPQPIEYAYLDGQLLFTYYHLAASDPQLTEVLLDKGVTAIAYETVEDEHGALPLLRPMSAVAGHMSVMIGSYYLARFNGGNGMLLGEMLGERYGKVLVLGDGVVGRHAARAAMALGADVTICGRHADRLPALRSEISPSLGFVLSSRDAIRDELIDADLVIGAVLVRGARAPYLVTCDMVGEMQGGSVIVDVSIDQGGCIETSHPTSHSEPVFHRDDVIHYCVTNMPGAYPRTSTLALTAATLPYAMRLADHGLEALAEDPGFARGVNTYHGHLTYREVAEALDMEERYAPFAELLDASASPA